MRGSNHAVQNKYLAPLLHFADIWRESDKLHVPPGQQWKMKVTGTGPSYVCEVFPFGPLSGNCLDESRELRESRTTSPMSGPEQFCQHHANVVTMIWVCLHCFHLCPCRSECGVEQKRESAGYCTQGRQVCVAD